MDNRTKIVNIDRSLLEWLRGAAKDLHLLTDIQEMHLERYNKLPSDRVLVEALLAREQRRFRR